MTDDQNIKQTQDVDKDENKEKPKEEGNIEDFKNKIKELEKNWLRALADYQNLLKRTQGEKYDAVLYGAQNTLLKFLNILDHLEEAQNTLTIKLFKDVLKSEGVCEMDRLNQEFDPNFDECVDKREGKNDNEVIEIIKKGYLIREKVLRPAKVIVEIVKN